MTGTMGKPAWILATLIAVIGTIVLLTILLKTGQLGVENVNLSYLAKHMEEFENKVVRVTGTSSYRFQVGPPKFWLDGVTVVVREGEGLPPENSIVTVIGTVIRVRENFYVISAESWTEAGS